MNDNVHDRLWQLLRPCGQEHLLRFWHSLNTSRRRTLAQQIRLVNWPLVKQLFQQRPQEDADLQRFSNVESPRTFHLDSSAGELSPELADIVGQAVLRAGIVGVVIVAGGQGSRLGFPQPKGMFPIGSVSGVSLFQILLEKVVALTRRYEVRIPVYLMTSPATHEPTVEFMQQHHGFGIPDEDLVVFCQGMMPSVDARTGRALLSAPEQISLSPDGHGGMLEALRRNELLEDMRARGVQHLFYMQVDNPLVPVAHARFIGYHVLSCSEVTTMVTRKQSPSDPVGNVILADGKLRMIEYSDLPQSLAEKRHADGSLVVWAGNLGVHLFTTSLLEAACEGQVEVPFHYALKKVPCIDEQGKVVVPTEPNAIKFERFIFDLMPATRRGIIVQVNPRQAFAPLKNSLGSPTDSPELVQAQMSALFADWVRSAGAQVDDGVLVEISPLYALDAEELRSKIPPDTHLSEDTYLVDESV